MKFFDVFKKKYEERSGPICEHCFRIHDNSDAADITPCLWKDIHYFYNFRYSEPYYMREYIAFDESVVELLVDPNFVFLKMDYYKELTKMFSLRSMLQLVQFEHIGEIYDALIKIPKFPLSQLSDLIATALLLQFLRIFLRVDKSLRNQIFELRAICAERTIDSKTENWTPLLEVFLTISRNYSRHNKMFGERVNMFDWSSVIHTMLSTTSPFFRMRSGKLTTPFKLRDDSTIEFVFPYRHNADSCKYPKGLLVTTVSGLSWMDSNWISCFIPRDVISTILLNENVKHAEKITAAVKLLENNISYISSTTIPTIYNWNVISQEQRDELAQLFNECHVGYKHTEETPTVYGNFFLPAVYNKRRAFMIGLTGKPLWIVKRFVRADENIDNIGGISNEWGLKRARKNTIKRRTISCLMKQVDDFIREFKVNVSPPLISSVEGKSEKFPDSSLVVESREQEKGCSNVEQHKESDQNTEQQPVHLEEKESVESIKISKEVDADNDDCYIMEQPKQLNRSSTMPAMLNPVRLEHFLDDDGIAVAIPREVDIDDTVSFFRTLTPTFSRITCEETPEVTAFINSQMMGLTPSNMTFDQFMECSLEHSAMVGSACHDSHCNDENRENAEKQLEVISEEQISHIGGIEMDHTVNGPSSSICTNNVVLAETGCTSAPSSYSASVVKTLGAKNGSIQAVEKESAKTDSTNKTRVSENRTTRNESTRKATDPRSRRCMAAEKARNKKNRIARSRKIKMANITKKNNRMARLGLPVEYVTVHTRRGLRTLRLLNGLHTTTSPLSHAVRQSEQAAMGEESGIQMNCTERKESTIEQARARMETELRPKETDTSQAAKNTTVTFACPAHVTTSSPAHFIAMKQQEGARGVSNSYVPLPMPKTQVAVAEQLQTSRLFSFPLVCQSSVRSANYPLILPSVQCSNIPSQPMGNIPRVQEAERDITNFLLNNLVRMLELYPQNPQLSHLLATGQFAFGHLLTSQPSSVYGHGQNTFHQMPLQQPSAAYQMPIPNAVRPASRPYGYELTAPIIDYFHNTLVDPSVPSRRLSSKHFYAFENRHRPSAANLPFSNASGYSYTWKYSSSRLYRVRQINSYNYFHFSSIRQSLFLPDVCAKLTSVILTRPQMILNKDSKMILHLERLDLPGNCIAFSEVARVSRCSISQNIHQCEHLETLENHRTSLHFSTPRGNLAEYFNGLKLLQDNELAVTQILPIPANLIVDMMSQKDENIIGYHDFRDDHEADAISSWNFKLVVAADENFIGQKRIHYYEILKNVAVCHHAVARAAFREHLKNAGKVLSNNGLAFLLTFRETLMSLKNFLFFAIHCLACDECRRVYASFLHVYGYVKSESFKRLPFALNSSPIQQPDVLHSIHDDESEKYEVMDDTETSSFKLVAPTDTSISMISRANKILELLKAFTAFDRENGKSCLTEALKIMRKLFIEKLSRDYHKFDLSFAGTVKLMTRMMKIKRLREITCSKGRRGLIRKSSIVPLNHQTNRKTNLLSVLNRIIRTVRDTAMKDTLRAPEGENEQNTRRKQFEKPENLDIPRHMIRKLAFSGLSYKRSIHERDTTKMGSLKTFLSLMNKDPPSSLKTETFGDLSPVTRKKFVFPVKQKKRERHSTNQPMSMGKKNSNGQQFKKTVSYRCEVRGAAKQKLKRKHSRNELFDNTETSVKISRPDVYEFTDFSEEEKEEEEEIKLKRMEMVETVLAFARSLPRPKDSRTTAFGDLSPVRDIQREKPENKQKMKKTENARLKQLTETLDKEFAAYEKLLKQTFIHQLILGKFQSNALGSSFMKKLAKALTFDEKSTDQEKPKLNLGLAQTVIDCYCLAFPFPTEYPKEPAYLSLRERLVYIHLLKEENASLPSNIASICSRLHILDEQQLVKGIKVKLPLCILIRSLARFKKKLLKQGIGSHSSMHLKYYCTQMKASIQRYKKNFMYLLKNHTLLAIDPP